MNHLKACHFCKNWNDRLYLYIKFIYSHHDFLAITHKKRGLMKFTCHKKLTTAIFISLAAFAPAASQAFMPGEAYISPKLGYTHINMDAAAYLNLANSPLELYNFASQYNDGQSGFSASLAAGYDFGTLRGEAEIIYFGEVSANNHINNLPQEMKTSSVAAFANAYFDISTYTPITPYIGGGLGLSSLNLNYTLGDQIKESRSEQNFAWHIGAGAAYKITSNMSLDMFYRYMNLGETRISSPSLSDISSNLEGFSFIESSTSLHQLGLGLRFTF